MERSKQYKKKTTGFGNIEEAKLIRAIEGLERRRKRRSDLFTSNRRLAGGLISPGISIGTEKKENDQQNRDENLRDVTEIKEDRAAKLAKWKKERELQRKLGQSKKRPVFRVRVYNHRLDSPIFLHQVKAAAKQVRSPPIVPRVTRATTKRLAAKSSARNNTTSTRRKNTEGITTRVVKSPAKRIVRGVSFAPDNHRFKPPDGLLSLPLFGEEALESTTAGTFRIDFSPYVAKPFGKKQSREILRTSDRRSLDNMKKKEEGAEAEIAEVKPPELRIEEEKEERTTKTFYFKTITDREVLRLKACCFDWMMVKSAPDLPEEAGAMIDQAIGQTNLLINKKMEQFRKLIRDCEGGSSGGKKLVTCEDLQGFWDMIYMQIEDCHSRFDKLDKLREKNWLEEEEEENVPKAKGKKRAPVKTAKKITAKNSSVRETILAAKRRKKVESRVDENWPVVVIRESKKPFAAAAATAATETSGLSNVKFDAGFLVVESPQKCVLPKSAKNVSPIMQTPKNNYQKENRTPNNTEMKRKRRRSTRLSVKFIGEESTGCIETRKTAVPMTPGAKQRTSKNPESKSRKIEPPNPTESSEESPQQLSISREVRKSVRNK